MNTKGTDIVRLDAKHVTVKQVYCAHLLAGRPFVLQGVTEGWPAMDQWTSGSGGFWSRALGADTAIQVDNGLERSWSGVMQLAEFEAYMKRRAWRRRQAASSGDATGRRGNVRLENETTLAGGGRSALDRAPWSSLYAYLHQHSRLSDGRYAADAMWDKIGAPRVLDRNNWFKLMGECFKMMTVTFWAPHGARQSNHQDDFGSSKWQAQIYGRKRWIMHPPEQSALLYNGLVDPFRPDLQRFPKYAEATPLDFVLGPGEVVVWSAGWWHATLALEDSLAIAQNLLNEHNYEEFRRTSQKACRPGGSHGIRSPWCACFRRCYKTWDTLYDEWRNSTAASPGSRDEYVFQDFTDPAALETAQCCDSLSLDGIDGVMSVHGEDHQTYYDAGEDYEAVLAKVDNEQSVEAAAKALIRAASQQRQRLLERARRRREKDGEEEEEGGGGGSEEEAEL